MRYPFPLPPAERIRHLFDYDPEGHLVLKNRTSSADYRRIGSRVGSLDTTRRGLRTIIDGRAYAVHRVIWLWHHGECPETHAVDHIDGDATNNKIANLRLATDHQNQQNRGKNRNNTSGFKGVSLSKSCGLWQCEISAFGKRHYLGFYKTREEAAAAYQNAAEQLHRDFRWRS